MSLREKVSLISGVMSVAATALHAQPATWQQAQATLQHVIIIMQENRSFDSYFGTFPGANGIPPGVCVPLDPANPTAGCVAPFHDVHDRNAGGPHNDIAQQADLDDGMTTANYDGFVYQQSHAAPSCAPGSYDCILWSLARGRHDAMGYHTADEIPNYWAYAQNFVLQDAMYESVRSWSMPSHLYLASEWSALCTNYLDSTSCTTNPRNGELPPKSTSVFPWANMFQLLDVNNVSWKYYLGEGAEPDCEDGEATCGPRVMQKAGAPSAWNVAPYFLWVKNQQAADSSYLAAHNPPADQFLKDLAGGTLPQVSWVIPQDNVSEHPANGLTAGMEYVTSMVNAVMQSPYWNNTVIFLTWDDFGGFYDHAMVPYVDTNTTTVSPIEGYGIRVPGLTISAYAQAGLIDHSIYSFDAYASFIENLFMNGATLDPQSLGTPDSRPTVRDALTQVTLPNGQPAPIGSLLSEFNFNQPPLSPLVLSTHIPTGIDTSCGDTGSGCTKPAVVVSWVSLKTPQVQGPFIYHVVKTNAAGVTSELCAVKTTKCTDSTPGSGASFYRVYTVDSSNVASPQSAAAEADEP